MSDTPTSSEGIGNGAEVAPPPILQDHAVLAAPPLKPVGERDRILTLDVLRGFALFGIIIVNIQWFAQPLMEAVQPAAEPSAADNACRMIVYTFFGSKFMTLFSLLFGMGLAVQSSRALAAGRPFAWRYIRRLVVLLMFGLAHAFLLWWGDILSLYAVAGFGLLLVHKFRASVLIILACLCMLMLATCLGGSVMMAKMHAQAETEYTEDEYAWTTDDPAYQEWYEEEYLTQPRWRRLLYDCGNWPWCPEFAEAERIAYGEGPMIAALTVRSHAFLDSVWYYDLLEGTFWRVLAVFLLGAALMKMGLFDPRQRTLRFVLCGVGLSIGLPLEAGYAVYRIWFRFDDDPLWIAAVARQVHDLTAILLALGYTGAISMIVSSGWADRLTKAVAATGRMALTNYIGHSVLASLIFYWWGLALFERVARPQQLALACGIYIAQLLFSLIWLRLFQFGPLEWLWRCLSYWRLLPIRRPRQAPPSST